MPPKILEHFLGWIAAGLRWPKRTALKSLGGRAWAQRALLGVALTLSLTTPAAAQDVGQPGPQCESQTVYFSHPPRRRRRRSARWFILATHDARAPLVLQAVDFWNTQLEQIGSPFRLGPITYTSTLVPVDFLQQRSLATLGESDVSDVPDAVNAMAGNIVVALSNGNFVSFTSRVGGGLSLASAVSTRSRSACPMSRSMPSPPTSSAMPLGWATTTTRRSSCTAARRYAGRSRSSLTMSTFFRSRCRGGLPLPARPAYLATCRPLTVIPPPPQQRGGDRSPVATRRVGRPWRTTSSLLSGNRW